MKRDKRESIIEAAAQCFGEYGYEKTTMSDIGKRVGLHKASLYYHFKDKADLFREMVESKRVRHLAQQKKTINKLSPGIEQVSAFIETEIEFIESLAMNFLAEDQMKEETLPVTRKLIQYYLQQLSSLLLSASGSENREKAETEETAQLLLKVSQGLLLADCPLSAPRSERAENYRRVRMTINTAVRLLLKGAGY